MSVIRSWPTLFKIWFGTFVVGFLFFGIIFSYNHGNQAFERTDGSTEHMVLHAADTYVKQGFMKYWLLPEYPAFGFDDEGKTRTEPFVYTHYFPGPSWILGVFKKVFSENGIWLARLPPLLLNVFGIAYLALQFALYESSALLGCALLSALLTARGITIFSISLAGHGYVMGIYFLALGFLFSLANKMRSNAKVLGDSALMGIGALIGFLQIEFSIDFVSVTFLSLMGMLFFLREVTARQSKNFLIGMVLGGAFGMALQIALFSMYLGSVSKVIENFVQWGTWRMGLQKFHDTVDEHHTLFQVLREYNRQAYGTMGFTAYNILALTGLFIALGYIGKIFNHLRTKRLLLGLLFTYLGAISWNALMRQHSWIHVHFIPRHYVVLFVYFLIVALVVSKELSKRSSLLNIQSQHYQ